MKNRIRVVSYNIHKGFSAYTRRFLLEEIRHSIRLVDADLVFLQEVVGENVRHHKHIENWRAQQFEFLADEVWPHYVYGKNAIYSHGHHGNAILSQQPIVEYNNKDISHIPTSRRGLLTGKTDNGIHLACLHFGLFEYERRRQVRSLLNFINDETDPNAPLIIAGDFNDWRKLGHKKISRESNLKEAFIEKRQCLARSFPARLPLLMMDRIYFRNMTLVDAEQLSGPPWNRLSDHCALYAEFSLDDR